jgi:hypothetical protein
MDLKNPNELNIDELRAATVPQLQQTGREYFGKELAGNKAQIFAQLSDLIIQAQTNQAKADVATKDPDLSNVQQGITTGIQEPVAAPAGDITIEQAREALAAGQAVNKPEGIQVDAEDAQAQADEEKPEILSAGVVLQALKEAQTPIDIPTTPLLLNKHTGMVFRNAKDIAVKPHIVAYRGRPVLVNGKMVMDPTYASIIFPEAEQRPLPADYLSSKPSPIPMGSPRG